MDAYDVASRLSQLDYEVQESDISDLGFAINRAAENIKANINRDDIPQGLYHTWSDMAAGLFLFDKKATGGLGDGFDFSAPAKKITEGDVSVEFSGQTDGTNTPEARFDKLLDSLVNPPSHVFTRFRRLSW